MINKLAKTWVVFQGLHKVFRPILIMKKVLHFMMDSLWIRACTKFPNVVVVYKCGGSVSRSQKKQDVRLSVTQGVALLSTSPGYDHDCNKVKKTT